MLDIYESRQENAVISASVRQRIEEVSGYIAPGSRVLLTGLSVTEEQPWSDFQFALLRAQEESLTRRGFTPEHMLIVDDSFDGWRDHMDLIALELPGTEFAVFYESSFAEFAGYHIGNWERMGKTDRVGNALVLKTKGQPLLMKNGRISHECLAASIHLTVGGGTRIGIYPFASQQVRESERAIMRAIRGGIDLPGEHHSLYFHGSALRGITRTDIYNKTVKL